jgi:hypothetical protein
MHWIQLARDRDHWWAPVNIVMNLRDPQNVGNFLSGYTTVGLSGRTRRMELAVVI